MTLPTVQVLLDNGTGTFPHDITGKVLYVGGLSLSRGRDDWQDAVTAGTLTLTLNNADGRFSPGSTTIASPSPITVDQRIRVKETVNGTTFTRFTGYVKAWPVSWPAVVATHSTVTISVTDAQARAERRVLRSVVEEEILTDSPTAHYTLGEPEGATVAADTSGNQATALTMTGTGTDVVFGTATGPGTDGLTAATFAGGRFLTTTLSAAPGTLECFFSASPAPSTAMVLMTAGTGAVLVGTDGKIHTGTGSDLSGPVVTDGATHHVMWQSGSVFLDGVDIGVPSATPNGATITIGGGASQGPSVPFTGTVSHVAAESGALSGARALAHAQAGLTGFAGESGTARLTRLASYAGLTLGTLDTSLTTVPFIDFTGRSAWDAIQEVADAELGSVYIDGSGNLTFHNRNETVAKATPDLTIDRQYVSPDVQPTQDDQRILNYLETTAAGTGIAQLVADTASEATHGRYPDSKTYLVHTDAEALDRGNWIVDNFAESSTRFGTLTIDLFRMTAAQASAALTAVDLDAWIRVTNFPSQTPGGTTVDVIVQGYREEVTDKTWKLACNVVARSLFSPVWILGDATAGVLGTTTRLYV